MYQIIKRNGIRYDHVKRVSTPEQAFDIIKEDPDLFLEKLIDSYIQSRMENIHFTDEDFEEFKQLYEKFKDQPKELVIFKGEVFVVEYMKYIIEYIELSR